jgi:cytochrome c553
MSVATALRAFFFSKILRWIAGSLLAIVVVAAAVLYGGSEWRLQRTYERPTIVLNPPEQPSAERGQRLATLNGCQGCHGAHGRVFLDVPALGRLIAPDLARTAAQYSDAELAVLLRAGIRRDGTSTLVMPANALSALADQDVADIIAWVRALKPEAETETATTSIAPLGRFLVLTGAFPMSAEMPRDPAPPAAHPVGSQHDVGKYWVKTACAHCHELDVERVLKPGLVAPPVRPMTQSYDLAQFTHLMRTGKAIGDREVGLMSDVARDGLSHLTDEEIAAIHAYLNEPVPETTAAAK